MEEQFKKMNTMKAAIRRLVNEHPEDIGMKPHPDMIEKEYTHREAFCAMKYKCDKCGIEEHIWNSRDGVTPFMVSCHACVLNGEEGSMQHVEWNRDLCIPQYKVLKGQRVFIDLTKEMARKYTAMKVVHWWGEHGMSERYDSPKAAFDALMEDWKPDGTPDVMVVPY